MNKKRFIPIVIIVLSLTVATLYFEVFRYWGKSDGKIEGSGTIEVTEIEVSTKIAGRVLSLPREEGEEVRKNELIAKIQFDELSAQRASIVASFTNARDNLGRIRRLYNTGAISQKDYDAAQTAYRVASAAFDQINATIGNAVILSPISGVVLEKNLEVGEMAFPGTPIVTIADLSKTWIKIYVDETRLGRVKLGQKAYVMVDSFPGKKFPGRVVAISNKAEFTPKTIQTKDERVKLMFAVKIAMDNPDHRLKPGMPADAEIITEKAK